MTLFTHRLSPESSDTGLDDAAGLLAFHIADAFPYSVTKTVAYDSQQQKVDYSCGDSSGINAFRHAPVFPFNLLMMSSAEEPNFHDKHNAVKHKLQTFNLGMGRFGGRVVGTHHYAS